MRKRIEKEDLGFERRQQTRERKDELSRELGREVPTRKTYGGDAERRPQGERREFNAGERRDFKPQGERREFNSGERRDFKPQGERREFNSGERRDFKPQGERREFNSGERRDFKPQGERREFNSGERRDFKPQGERREFNSGERRDFKPQGERREFNSGERRDFKPQGERREFNSGERRDFKPQGERREFNSGERRDFKPQGERREFNSGERRDFKPQGERREFNSGERRDFKPQGERREFNSGERRDFKPQGERREFNSGERRDFKPQGERREFNSGERRDFKPQGERREFNSGERRDFKPQGERREFNSGERRDFKPQGDKPAFERKEFVDKRKPVGKRFDKGDFNKPRPGVESFEKKSRGDKSEKTFGSSKANFGGDNLFKAHRPVEQSDKWTPNYKLDKYKETAPKKVQKLIEKSEHKSTSEVRLNRYIANSGVCSRREADDLIKAGEIKVNGTVVTEMGYQVKPGDIVKYGSKKLNREKMVYVLVNKPKDFITTTEDPNDRKTVMDLVKNACEERIYPVGRLDRNTTGLLLLTNDGELADKLTHPSNEVEKLYQVELDKPLTEEHFEQIKGGITLEDGEIKADELGIVTPDAMVVGIKIHSGRNRIVRRIFESLGYEVLKLDRTTFAGLTKKDLPRGTWRFLTEREVVKLKFYK
ncbi:pseudouridine synthase [Arcicella rigui]|uniref:Pseudouridine synthase n=1 Tax=Arcicella rigui TaxID=797020 RepID=A0ABU5QBP6_9BACT|nr:pseudouridine synthase [Arcicella rigui]MEA5140153.1 pseudouridine synthase [Arcicella rigui]